MIERYKANIRYHYQFMWLKIDFTQGFWMIFLAGKGMSLVQLGLLETVFHLTSFAMEVPTGMVADLYGRKPSRIIGRLLFVLAMCVMLLGKGFWTFAIGFVLQALSYNLESGAGEALVFDSLKASDETHRYLGITGRVEGIFQTTRIVAFLVGGVIAGIDYRGIFLLSILSALFTLIPAFRWTEPPFKAAATEQLKPIAALVGLVRESIGVIRTNRKVGFFIFSMEFLLSLATVLFFYLQNYWKALGFEEWQIGVFFVFSAVAGILGGLLAERIEARLGQKRFLLVFSLMTILGVWGVALTRWHVAAFVAVTFVDSLIYVGMNDYINREIESHIRATVLSLASMVFSFYMILLFPAFGWLAGHEGFAAGFVGLGVVGAGVWLLNARFLIRNLE